MYKLPIRTCRPSDNPTHQPASRPGNFRSQMIFISNYVQCRVPERMNITVHGCFGSCIDYLFGLIGQVQYLRGITPYPIACLMSAIKSPFPPRQVSVGPWIQHVNCTKTLPCLRLVNRFVLRTTTGGFQGLRDEYDLLNYFYF